MFAHFLARQRVVRSFSGVGALPSKDRTRSELVWPRLAIGVDFSIQTNELSGPNRTETEPKLPPHLTGLGAESGVVISIGQRWFEGVRSDS